MFLPPVFHTPGTEHLPSPACPPSLGPRCPKPCSGHSSPVACGTWHVTLRTCAPLWGPAIGMLGPGPMHVGGGPGPSAAGAGHTVPAVSGQGEACQAEPGGLWLHMVWMPLGCPLGALWVPPGIPMGAPWYPYGPLWLPHASKAFLAAFASAEAAIASASLQMSGLPMMPGEGHTPQARKPPWEHRRIATL